MSKQPKPEENAEFVMFWEEFQKYQKLFGLTGYRVCFDYDTLDDDFAAIEIDLHSMVVRVTLNSKLPSSQGPYKDIKRQARHEAIHLLIGRVVELAKSRCISGPELFSATEELAHKLEGLVPQIESSKS